MISSFPALEEYSDEEDEEHDEDEARPDGLASPGPGPGPGRIVAVEHHSATAFQPSVVVTAPAAPAQVAPDLDPRRLSAVDAWKAVATNAEGKYRRLVRLAAPLVAAFDGLRTYDEFAHLQSYEGAAGAVAQLLEERAEVRRAWAEIEAREGAFRRLQDENHALRRQAELPVRLY